MTTRFQKVLVGDATQAFVSDASVVFMCSLCFPAPVLAALGRRFPRTVRPGSVVLTINPFLGCQAGLYRIGHIKMPQSWTDTMGFHVYLVAPGSPGGERGMNLVAGLGLP